MKTALVALLLQQLVAVALSTKVLESSQGGDRHDRAEENRSVSSLRKKKETPMTDEERIEYAKRVIREVKERLEQQQMEDMTKKEFCDKQTKELEENLDETKAALDKEQFELAKAEAKMAECGCCCDDYASINYELSLAKQDLEFQETRLENLEQQAEHLENWCALG
eukprot:gb/GFBE01024751.1/.p1 GENE.gb/GFBE01024751.1/~~gb/GFBE01024751.1/.p1  ORF type:complete len:167 (+),score=67.72 gb/GFBE01024751.1/:1-501(+)